MADEYVAERIQTGGSDSVKYLIVIEETDTGYSAYSPDVLDCVSTGATPKQIRENMREALELRVEGLRQEAEPVHLPTCTSSYVEVAA